MTLSVIIALKYCQQTFSKDNQILNNVAFITLAFAQLFHVFNMASARSKLFKNEITKNKFVWLAILICTGLMIAVYLLPQTRVALGLVKLPQQVWIFSIAASLLPVVFVQFYKIIIKLKHSKSKK